MKNVLTLILTLAVSVVFAQQKDKALLKSNDFIYEGNTLIGDDFISAEKEYRKAISEKPSNSTGAYNLGNAYYDTGNYDEALLRHVEAAKLATTRNSKHIAYHNMGNALMQQKLCKKAVEAFKNALRNDPTDEESRYNLVVAKECAEEQQKNEDKNKDKDKDKEDEKKEDEDKKDDQKDEGDKDKKEGDDKEDEEGKPNDEKDNKKDGEPDDKKKKQQPQPEKLSPQQVKSLLEAMSNEEKKVQAKMNAKKAKGKKVKTEKDW